MRSLLTKNEGHLGALCREAVEENLSNVLVTAAKTLIRTATSVKRPFDLHRVAVIGYLFMLREVELSTILYDSVELNTDTTCISILLTASETDPCAGGCVCDEGEHSAEACPYHAGLGQQQELLKPFGCEVVQVDGFPISPR